MFFHQAVIIIVVAINLRTTIITTIKCDLYSSTIEPYFMLIVGREHRDQRAASCWDDRLKQHPQECIS